MLKITKYYNRIIKTLYHIFAHFDIPTLAHEILIPKLVSFNCLPFKNYYRLSMYFRIKTSSFVLKLLLSYNYNISQNLLVKLLSIILIRDILRVQRACHKYVSQKTVFFKFYYMSDAYNFSKSAKRMIKMLLKSNLIFSRSSPHRVNYG